MRRLTVELAYGTADAGSRRAPDGGLALPVKVLDFEGSVLAEGATSRDAPLTLELAPKTDLAFVRLAWPSGRFETQRVSFEGRSELKVTFSDVRISPNEWSAWAIPKLNPRTPLALPGSAVDLGLERFNNVWLRLWKFADGAWRRETLIPDATYRNGAAWQLDLTLDMSSWLLQVGGSQVIWRFVSLPGGGPARILITPRDSSDPRADELKVVVTSFRADAETLLEFLARDSLRAAGALADSDALAQQLFSDKHIDPVSAVAGAYYLLRVGAWQRVPLYWYENLSQQFYWLPDAAVIHCVRLLRDGSNDRNSISEAIGFLRQSVGMGWPVYNEGISLLQEAAGLLRGRDDGDLQSLLDRVQSLGAAKAWAGAAASFYGREPGEPSILQWVGMPRAPRRKRLDPALAQPRRWTDSEGLPTRPRTLKATGAIRSPEARALGGPTAGEFVLGSIRRKG